jgi:DNA ligase-associated metallophosphoesterase
MQIELRNHHFDVLPQKALFWHEKEILILGDIHLGKIAHFRREGIPLPRKASQENFHLLDGLVENHRPKELVILGDLFHSSPNEEWDEFLRWRKNNEQVVFHLILGNHDRHVPTFFSHGSAIQLHASPLVMDGFQFCHEPENSDDLFVFCGHIHPVFTLRANKQKLRFPCLWINGNRAVLPGFGYFTGGFEVQKEEPDDRIIVFTGNSVREI